MLADTNRPNGLCQIEAGELKGKVPELKQGARTGAERQNWSRASELEQGDSRWRSRTAGDGHIANQQRNREELYSGE